MTGIAVVDHGAGNLVSIARGLERAGASVNVVDGPAGLRGADGVVLPGVGTTAAVMDGIRSGGFEDALRSLDVPLFGICVGMQVLFDTSEEDGADCLGLIPGVVRPLDGAPRLPHIGWNELATSGDEPLFSGLGPRPVVYFVHSFAPVPADHSVVVATSSYDDPFVAAVRSGPVSGTQFHPERSGAVGLQILANVVAECARIVA
ncbi:MAG: imidazole glycerol phosphate synthase subunit HisH [Acidimicrobiia bacterium]